MRLSLLSVLFLIAACQQMPLPVTLAPESYRQGSFSPEMLGVLIKEGRFRIPPEALSFTSPSFPLTYADVRGQVKVELKTQPESAGGVEAMVFLAPLTNGQCLTDAVYREEHLVFLEWIPLNTPSLLAVKGQLTPAQLQGLNRGRLCLGLEVFFNSQEFVSRVRLDWEIQSLVAGVGLL